jgi:multiple sugar transport system permease protein
MSTATTELRGRASWIPTAVLLLGAVYCLLPVAWVVIASTKSGHELFSTFTFLPGTGFADNIADLSAYRDGVYWTWMANSLLYAGLGALLSCGVSALSGYALARYRFRGREAIFNILLTGVLMPPVILALPQYLLLAKADMADTYLSVLLPNILSPYGIYLARIYASAAVPAEMVEAGRMDGAGEWRIFRAVALPMMRPGLVTVFLFQFVGIWNNFFLPLVMLTDPDLFPMSLGLYHWSTRAGQFPQYTPLVIIGSLLAVVPLVLAFVLLQRQWRSGLAIGSVK